MERLILLRHAKAASEAQSGDDFDRPLAPRGLREAQAVAVQLAALGFRPDISLVSPALRTRQTWEPLNAALPGGEVRFERALYNIDAQGLRRLIGEAGEDQGTVLVVGHNPGLQDLVQRMLLEAGGPTSFIAQAQRGFPPAAMAVFDIDPFGRLCADRLVYPEREA